MSEIDESKIETSGETSPPVWPRVVTLKYPFEFAGERIATIEMRRGRAGDMKGIKLQDVLPSDDLHLIASRLSGRPLRVIESLDFEDAGEVIDIALDFYKSYLQGGRKRSR